ncbi:DUF493 domain-containing protein [Halosquirtibacter laminarini]|uniref:DUF493 domain-containing protein n=1 Tax=Halosquirtibacter laminarini TaxID=3374600 RepID=A0AC61NN97_9BACT|nr:DUF493 domain-containing protein [Prolixibacteraceae bacterium]
MLDPYKRLEEILKEDKSWPKPYMYKFIVPNHDDKVNKVKKMMPEPEKVVMRSSKDLKYISISLKTIVNSADDILELYKRIDQVEGVIKL